jgi:phosphate-selective porin
MIKTFFASAALLLVTAAPALAGEKPTEITFQRDGETYTYTKTEKAGLVILKGRFPTGNRFKLIVRGNKVTGTVDGMYFSSDISFSMPLAPAKPGAAELAAR